MFKNFIDAGDGSYIIIDDDFEEITRSNLLSWADIINSYKKRNLPVVSNLIRFMLWYRDKNGWSLDYQFAINKANNPRWPEVEQDIKKYLLFS